MNFYIADTHFGHGNIIRLCSRPFRSVEDMNETIIQNWNRKVNDSDTVYIVGDFAFKGLDDAVKILKRLKGNKILITGNHDNRNLKNPNFRSCFNEIRELMDIVDNGVRVVLCHYPLIEWNGYFRGSYLVYGHIHNNIKNNAYKCMALEGHALNAGVDITDFEPCTLNELKEKNKVFEELCFGHSYIE